MECPLLLTPMKWATSYCFRGQTVYIIVSSAHQLVGHPSWMGSVPFRLESGFARRHLHGFCGNGVRKYYANQTFANQIQPPDVHNILLDNDSPSVLDLGVPERAKMAFEMKDRLDQLRRSSVRVTVRAEIAIRPITSYRREFPNDRKPLNLQCKYM